MKWLAGLSLPAAVLSALLGGLSGAGAYTVYVSEAASYLSNDPRSCVNCHVMREHYDGWQKASHHARATCNDCHVPHALLPKALSKIENGYRHSKGFTFQDFHEPIRIRPGNARTLNRNCLECHGELLSEVAAHPEPPDCVRCHGTVGHGPSR
jgi:cytochrome c nitrite reductase small subunit